MAIKPEIPCLLQGEAAGQSEHVVIIVIVFGLILGGMVITFIVNCIRKIIRDQKIIRVSIANFYAPIRIPMKL